MSRAKPTPVPLSELTPGQHADFFALLAEKTKGVTLPIIDHPPDAVVNYSDPAEVIELC